MKKTHVLFATPDAKKLVRLRALPVRAQVKQLVVSLVLSTDMCQHFSLLAVWEARVRAQPDIWAWPDRTLLLVMLMHLADIVNPARAPPIAIKWGTLVVNEFMAQVCTLWQTRIMPLMLRRDDIKLRIFCAVNCLVRGRALWPTASLDVALQCRFCVATLCAPLQPGDGAVWAAFKHVCLASRAPA